MYTYGAPGPAPFQQQQAKPPLSRGRKICFAVALFFGLLVWMLAAVAISTSQIYWDVSISTGSTSSTQDIYLAEAKACDAGSCTTTQYDSNSFTSISSANSDFNNFMKTQREVAATAFAFAFLGYLFLIFSFVLTLKGHHIGGISLATCVFWWFLTWVLLVSSPGRFSSGFMDPYCKSSLGSGTLLWCSDTSKFSGSSSSSNISYKWGPQPAWNCAIAAWVFSWIVFIILIVQMVASLRNKRAQPTAQYGPVGSLQPQPQPQPYAAYPASAGPPPPATGQQGVYSAYAPASYT